MLSEGIAVYRSTRLKECEERAFILTAVGIPNEMDREGAWFVLWVDPAALEQARHHLRQYQLEQLPPPPPPPPPPHWPRAWVGCAVYAAVLIGVAYAISSGMGRLDAFSVGELYAARVQQGQWWRAWTALTLHVSLEHLLGNLLAGLWFGYLAGRRFGPGVGWALIVAGGGTANLLEALLGPAAHRAVGASTAVFTALGLLSACTWRERYRFAQHWALRWGPLVAGVVLLGWTGTAGKHTDVVAHIAGFLVGALMGSLIAHRTVEQLLARVPQWLAGAMALAVIALAWTYALLS